MATKIKEQGTEHIASAKAVGVPVSTKHSIEISKFLRYKPLSFAKAYLSEVIDLKKAIPFKTFNRDRGHKAGMAAGRFPEKAAKEFLKLLNSAESNAQFKGLNVSNLKIIKLLANKAAIPMTGGRNRTSTKRTHLEVEVKELRVKKVDNKRAVKKDSSSKEPSKLVKETPKPIEKEAVLETKEEVKTEAKAEVKSESKEELKVEEKMEASKEWLKEIL